MKKLLAVALAATVSAGAFAQAFPAKPITFVVPFAAGGPTDLVARRLAEAMRKPLGGANIVVENAAGAGGTIAGTKVARANPDGYTLLLALSNSMLTNQFLYTKLPYSPEKDIAPIYQIAIAPLVLLWLGFDARSIVTLVALICFFPIFVGTFIGVRSTPQVLRDLFRTLDASGFKTFLHCSLPHASGSIIAGMQVGWGFALVGCVVMEFIMGIGGAGFLIDNSANALDTVTAVAPLVLPG
eukprot:gene19122-biopygen12180